MNTVTICSKLPVSLILNHPLDPGTRVTIRGLNAAQRGTNGQPIAVPFITTEVDADFWDSWGAAHGPDASRPFPTIKSGGIYLAATPDHAKGIAREQEARRTGLEGMRRDDDPRMGKRTHDQVETAKD